MQELTDKQLFDGLRFARSQDQQAGQAILERFQTSQPAFAETLFRVFPSVMIGLDQAMAHAFMDLCFDVIAVYEHVFGKAPDQRIVGNRWFEEKAQQFDSVMKGAIGQAKSDSLATAFEQERQTGLVSFLHAAIDQQVYQSFAAVRIAKTMIFTTVQLFDALYDAAVERQNQAIH